MRNSNRKARASGMLPGEQILITTRQHWIVVVGAAFVAVIGVVFLVRGVQMSLTHYSYRLSLNDLFDLTSEKKGGAAHRHRQHRVSQGVDIGILIQVLWMLLSLPFLYLGLHIWQVWKHTTYSVANRRLIKRRTRIWFLPWITPGLDQTPFEQIADIDDRTGLIGNMTKQWGTVVVTLRLQRGSDSELQRLDYRLLPDYEEFADILRAARQNYATVAEEERTRAERERAQREADQLVEVRGIRLALDRIAPPPEEAGDLTQDLPDPGEDTDTGEIPPVQ